MPRKINYVLLSLGLLGIFMSICLIGIPVMEADKLGVDLLLLPNLLAVAIGGMVTLATSMVAIAISH